jgi:DNA polymerase-3 subunit chi
VTDISFHFGAPDKAAYACRYLRKAFAHGARVQVICSPEFLTYVDRQLWALSATDFVAHCGADADDFERQIAPVLLNSTDQILPRQAEILLNLTDDLCEGFEAYEKVVEVVSLDENDRNHARNRWRRYTDLGFLIQRHDLALKG